MKRHLRNTGVLLAAMMLAAPNLAQDTGPERRGQDRPQRDRPQRDQAQQQQRRLRVPDSVQYMPDIVYSTAPGADGSDGEPVELLMDVAFPKQSNNQPLPAVVYIHGGGFIAGDKASGGGIAVMYAEGGYFAATINYRLGGVAPFPAAVHDCKAAIRFLRANADKLGIDPDRIGVFGRSAGAHLAGFIGLSGNHDSAAIEGELAPTGVSSAVQCIVTSSAPVDFMKLVGRRNNTGPETWLGQDPDTYAANAKLASPLNYIDDDDPPILVLHGTVDRVVPFEQAEMFRAALEATSITSSFLFVEGAPHTNLGGEARVLTARWFDQHLGGRAAPVISQRNAARAPRDNQTDRPRRDRGDRGDRGQRGGRRGGGGNDGGG